MNRPQIKANVRWFSTRQRTKRNRRTSPRQIVSLRLHEFAVLFHARYGITLPDDDAGRDDLEPVIHHLASLPHPKRRITAWLETWAPWLTLAEQREIVVAGIATARPWTADQLAWRYRVTKEERTMLGLTTIGAVDQGKGARTKQRKQRDRERKASQRRAAGAIPRQQYEAASLARAKPWIAEGISRRTWYRRRRRDSSATDGTGPSTA